MNNQQIVLKVGFDLKGDKVHHAAEITLDRFDPYLAWKMVMEHFKAERIERALVLIDCIELNKRLGVV